jgi:hypothetical protein
MANTRITSRHSRGLNKGTNLSRRKRNVLDGSSVDHNDAHWSTGKHVPAASTVVNRAPIVYCPGVLAKFAKVFSTVWDAPTAKMLSASAAEMETTLSPVRPAVSIPREAKCARHSPKFRTVRLTVRGRLYFALVWEFWPSWEESWRGSRTLKVPFALT